MQSWIQKIVLLFVPEFPIRREGTVQAHLTPSWHKVKNIHGYWPIYGMEDVLYCFPASKNKLPFPAVEEPAHKAGEICSVR